MTDTAKASVGMFVTASEVAAVNCKRLNHHKPRGHHTRLCETLEKLAGLDLVSVDALHAPMRIPAMRQAVQMQQLRGLFGKLALSDGENVRSCVMFSECMDVMVRAVPEMRMIQREMRAVYESMLDYDTAIALHTTRYAEDVASSYNTMHRNMQMILADQMRDAEARLRRKEITTQEYHTLTMKYVTCAREMVVDLVRNEAVEGRTGSSTDIKCERAMILGYFSNTADQVAELKHTSRHLEEIMAVMQTVSTSVLPILLDACAVLAVASDNRMGALHDQAYDALCTGTGVTAYQHMLKTLPSVRPDVAVDIERRLRPSFQLRGEKLAVGALNCAADASGTTMMAWHDPRMLLDTPHVFRNGRQLTSATMLLGGDLAGTLPPPDDLHCRLVTADSVRAQQDRAAYVTMQDLGRVWREKNHKRLTGRFDDIHTLAVADRCVFAVEHGLSTWWIATMQTAYQDSLADDGQFILRLLSLDDSAVFPDDETMVSVERNMRLIHDHAHPLDEKAEAIAFFHAERAGTVTYDVATFAEMAGFDMMDEYTATRVNKLADDVCDEWVRCTSTANEHRASNRLPLAAKFLVDEILFSAVYADRNVSHDVARQRHATVPATIPARCIVKEHLPETVGCALRGITAAEKSKMRHRLRTGTPGRIVRRDWLRGRSAQL